MTADTHVSLRGEAQDSLPIITPLKPELLKTQSEISSLRAVLDAHPECVMLLERDRTVSYVSPNGQCPRTLEPFDILVGTDWVSLYPEAAKAPLAADLAAAFAGESPTREIDIDAFDGTARRWVFRLSPIRSSSGTLDRVFMLSYPLETVRPSNLATHEADHRIKNSLAAVSSLLRVQARGSNSDEVREALDSAAQRVLSVGRVHSYLQRPVEADNGTYVSTQDFLGPLAIDLVASLGGSKVTLLYEIDDIRIGPDEATALGLIVTEAIINALRHGFGDRPQGGLVHLSVHPVEDGTARVEIADTGEGLPDEFAPGDGNGIGGRIVALYARGLGGRIHYGESALGGASFVLEF